MKKILITFLLTALITSAFWFMVVSVRLFFFQLYVKGDIVVPVEFAVHSIDFDLQQGRNEFAMRKLQILNDSVSALLDSNLQTNTLPDMRKQLTSMDKFTQDTEQGFAPYQR